MMNATSKSNEAVASLGISSAGLGQHVALSALMICPRREEP